MTDDLAVPATLAFGPGVDAALEQINAIAARIPPVDVEGSRRFYRAIAPLGGSPPELHQIRDLTVRGPGGDLALRVYRPAPGRLPVALLLHGGWFFLGDLETHDILARALARAAGCVVVAVDYRRAPEHPCPAAPNDCLAAARWIVAHAEDLGVDGGALAVVGDSAGGALAAVTTRRARDAGDPWFCQQVLLYPVISAEQDSASWRELVAAPLVNVDRARFAWSMYLPSGSTVAPADAAPGACADLSDLPPTLIITAEFDPLRDEGEAYGAALRAAGVPAVVHRYPGMIHGFAGLAGTIPAGREAIAEVARALRAAFAGLISDPVAGGHQSTHTDEKVPR
jgi:acetyl esterase